MRSMACQKHSLTPTEDMHLPLKVFKRMGAYAHAGVIVEIKKKWVNTEQACDGFHLRQLIT